MKRKIAILLFLFLCVLAAYAIPDDEIIEAVVDNFMMLTQVPRPSHHEEKISNFLMEWGKKQGFKPVRDKVNNIMFNVPATKGMENKPLGILQGHMDMVVAVKDGKKFDPLNDPITVIRGADGTLTADGTSLGGDDGIGDAIIMAIAQGKMAHGPLRMIITVNEEDGMDGAFKLDKSWLEGASFLINIDNETSDEILVSTAAGDSVRGNKKIPYGKASLDAAMKLEISNLKGGHSGIEINKGRLNGIRALASFLKQLEQEGTGFELALFEGGTAPNAIPAKASAIIVVDKKDKEKIRKSFSDYCKVLNEKFKGIEEDIKVSVTDIAELPKVVPPDEKRNLITMATGIIDGVYTWSADMEGLVESSSNLGIFKMNEEGLSFITYIRSSNAIKEKEILESQIALSRTCTYSFDTVKMADAWKYDPDSRLMALAKKIYKEQNKEEAKVVAVHAGLECGTFKALSPDIDMISIGPDITDAHSIKETLYLKSVPKIWHWLEEIFARL